MAFAANAGANFFNKKLVVGRVWNLQEGWHGQRTAWGVTCATKATHLEQALAAAVAAVFIEPMLTFETKHLKKRLDELPVSVFVWRLRGRALRWEFFRTRLCLFGGSGKGEEQISLQVLCRSHSIILCK